MQKTVRNFLSVAFFNASAACLLAVCILTSVSAEAAALPGPAAGRAAHASVFSPDAPFRDGDLQKGLPGNVLSEGHLLKEGDRLLYLHSNGRYAYSEWKKIRGKRYYFNKYGYAMTGLQFIGSRTYYFNAEGVQQTKDQYVGGKLIRFNRDGSVYAVGDRYYTIPSSRRGRKVVEYAKKFLGNPYRWGGSSLTRGADCSGFVMAVYAHFGVSLPHYDASIRKCGRPVASLSEAAAGDVICYDGHVAIYMGDGRIIHAADERHGICIGNDPAFMRILSIRRFF